MVGASTGKFQAPRQNFVGCLQFLVSFRVL
jgi:hypothetical protein